MKLQEKYMQNWICFAHAGLCPNSSGFKWMKKNVGYRC